MITITDVVQQAPHNNEPGLVITVASLMSGIPSFVVLVALTIGSGYWPPLLIWVLGWFLNFVITGFVCKLDGKTERNLLMWLLLAWPTLYASLIIANICMWLAKLGPVLCLAHSGLGNAHQKLSSVPKLFARKPKLLPEQKTPKGKNMYRNQSECDACHRPL